MTGYKSKKAAAQDSNGMTFADRCQVSEQCLPDAPYRAMLIALHNEMLEALAQPAQEPVAFSAEIVADVNGTLSTQWADWWIPNEGDKLYTAPPQPAQERNFCSRCGKRTNEIHTCTPPQENT